MSNIINTRIKVKYDTLAAWNSSTFVPLQGEVCVAVIPNGDATEPTRVYDPNRYPNNDRNNTLSGLSPYAVGVKVGDGVHRFSALPWIQAIAGDVYSWAKLPTGGSIPITYNNQTSTIQAAIAGLEASIGGLVSANLTPEALSQALQQLSEQLGGGEEVEKFKANNYTETTTTDETTGETITTRTYNWDNPTKIIRRVSQTGLNVTVEGSELVLADLPFQFQTTPSTSNKAATISDINTRIEQISEGITSVMHFTGQTLQELPDATAIQTFEAYEMGDVVLVGTKEYVYSKGNTAAGSSWILLGDEGSYAVKGSIAKSDLTQALQDEITAAENTIEAIQVNNTTINPNNNKVVNITVPTGALADKDNVSKSDLSQALQSEIEGYANTLEGVQIPSPSGGYVDLTIDANKKIQLAKIANSGSIYDVTESFGQYLVFDCGTATSLIN